MAQGNLTWQRGDITGDIYDDYLCPQNQDPIPFVRMYLMIDGSPAYQVKTDGTHTNTRKYYAFGNSSIAMRENGVLTWLMNDQINSTTVTAAENGTLGSEIRYTAFGETRWVNGVTVTDQRYTGQREEVEIDLYYYVARWYDPVLAHFTQADTVVPEPGSILAYLRYAYVSYNPIRYSDPSGHKGWQDDGQGGNITNFGLVMQQTYKHFVKNVFKPYSEDLYKPEWNTEERVEGVISNYEQVRVELFLQYGMRYIDRTGKINDRVFMSITAAAEFGSFPKDSNIYKEGIEALSRQYNSDKPNYGPMRCKGSCNLANQILWATQMEAWYRDKPLTEYLISVDLAGPLSAGAQAATPGGYENGTYSSWFWGNVDEAGKAKYEITTETLNGLYPGKPYFIVYSWQLN